MRAILGLLPPSGGSVEVFGHARRARGLQRSAICRKLRTVLPDLRVRGRDFIASSLNGERWGLPSLSHQDRATIEATLDAVGARDLAARPLSEMSGGERQRLLLAQALIGATEAAAARRAIDQPRRAPSGNCDRCRAQGLSRAQDHRPVQRA